MDYRTPPSRSRSSLIPPSPTDTPSRRSAARHSIGGELLRDRRTPVGKLLASEGVAVRSPRRVRSRPWTEKVLDWPSNFMLQLEESISLFDLDFAGYPIAMGFHALHFASRLGVFTKALPIWTSTSPKQYARIMGLGDADARLEALQREASSGRWRFGWGTTLSLLLVLVACGNAAYLFSRRKTYTFTLRQDPLASPNARPATLDFTPLRSSIPISKRISSSLKALIFGAPEEESHAYPVQELDVWVPDHSVWSLHLFSLYPPPVAVMYHFLSLSNFLPFVICGLVLVAQCHYLVYSYTHLLSDRATIQSEVMREYNARFVAPRVFVKKFEMGTTTNEAEMISADDWRGEHGTGENARKGTPSRQSSTDIFGMNGTARRRLR